MEIMSDDYIGYMVEKYVKKGYLIWEIAVEFNCHPATIYRLFQKYKIKLREYEGRKKGIWVKGHTGTIGIKRPDVTNEKHPNWKGNRVGYQGVHWWVKRRLKKPKRCQRCHKVKKLDMTNISGKYKRDLKDWEYVCRSCHMIKDDRLVNMRKALRAKREAEWKSRKEI